VFRSLRFTYAQLISDETNEVLGSATSKALTDVKSAKSVDAAKHVGAAIAKIAQEQKIERVVFDRNGYLYHGRVEAVAQGAREGGLQF
jgi:large subunit ribosomal protein L18